MSGARKFVNRVLHSGGSDGQKPGGDGQPPDIQQPGGDHSEQVNNQQSQLEVQERGSGKISRHNRLRSLSPFTKTRRSAPEATTTGYSRPPSQSDAVVSGSGTLAPASDKIDITASPNRLTPPGLDPVLPSGESQHPPATPTHPPSDTAGLDGGDDTMPQVYCSPPPHQETASAGKPEVSATIIPTSNLPDIVITTISPMNPSPQTPDPVSTPASDPQALPIISQAVRDANYIDISDTKNSPSTMPPAMSSHLWQKVLEIAQESLAKYKLPALELGSLQSQSAAENIQSLVAELETAHEENKDRQWRYKDRQGNEVVWVERLGNILKSVDKYAKIVDTAIQHHPDITSLVWAGARTMLQVCYGSHCGRGPLGGSSLLISGRLL